MRRREFLGILGGAAALPLAARAQEARPQQMYRVAILTPSQTQWQPRIFRDTLTELGFREGVNLQINVVSAENQMERLPRLAEEPSQASPDVIVAVNTPALERQRNPLAHSNRFGCGGRSSDAWFR